MMQLLGHERIRNLFLVECLKMIVMLTSLAFEKGLVSLKEVQIIGIQRLQCTNISQGH